MESVEGPGGGDHLQLMTGRREADRAAALEALSRWPRRRDRLPADRADLVAAAWGAGARNIAQLAQLADVSRDTIYSDLRAREIDWSDRDSVGSVPPGTGGGLRPETVAEIARQSAEALSPAMRRVEEPDPLTSAAWQMSIGYDRLAELLGDLPADRLAEVAADLAFRLRLAMRYVHGYWASHQDPAALAAYTEAAQIDTLDDQALVSRATFSMVLPAGQSITIDVGEADDHQPARGWSTARTETGLLDTPLDGADHLELLAAFDTIGQVLTRHLGDEAFES